MLISETWEDIPRKDHSVPIFFPIHTFLYPFTVNDSSLAQYGSPVFLQFGSAHLKSLIQGQLTPPQLAHKTWMATSCRWKAKIWQLLLTLLFFAVRKAKQPRRLSYTTVLCIWMVDLTMTTPRATFSDKHGLQL